MAAYYQFRPPPMAPNPNSNEHKFEKCARLAVEVAAKLAPYQSPTFRAIVVAPEQPKRTRVTRFTLSIFDKRELGPERGNRDDPDGLDRSSTTH